MSAKKNDTCIKLSYFKKLSEWFAIFQIIVNVSVLFRGDCLFFAFRSVERKSKKKAISRRLIQWVMNEVRANKKRERLLLSRFSGSIGSDNSFARRGICRGKKSGSVSS